jgi:hypothetical protein
MGWCLINPVYQEISSAGKEIAWLEDHHWNESALPQENI